MLRTESEESDCDFRLSECAPENDVAWRYGSNLKRTIQDRAPRLEKVTELSLLTL